MTAPLARKRDAPATKARILAAAQEAFATIGYAQAGIREIAARAETSPTLLIRYFGSKAGLFKAALSEAMRAGDLFGEKRAGMGRWLAEIFTRADIVIHPPAMIALAAADPQASAIAARVVEDLAIRPFAAWLGGENARARSVQVFILATSFVLYTRQVPVVQGGDPAMVDWLAASLQAIIDEVRYFERTDGI